MPSYCIFTINPIINIGKIGEMTFFKRILAKPNIFCAYVLIKLFFEKVPNNPKQAADNKAKSFRIYLGISQIHAGLNATSDFNSEMTIMPDFKTGIAKIYDAQNPEKFDKQTRGINIKITFTDSFFKPIMPDSTKEKIKIGKVKIITSLINKLREYIFSLIDNGTY